ncbi:response regulator transcription factor [Methylophaga sp.]|uniref:LuxR C-terminal-related transcriptional regulator n=1 Tax=Methylophaga sp. TaxID=2024840 RepID=UPI002728924D|nr:response regulator transcription factor [Methylophaga sp.]MDO8827573.1 response regulator transcription factor [Methylophaga sp.]
MQKATTIFLVDSNRLFRESMGALIATWPGFLLAGEAATADQALAVLKNIRADIVLFDIDLIGKSGFVILKHLVSEQRSEKLVILTRELQPEYIREALLLGACGYLSHESSAEQIQQALCMALSGKTVIDPLACKALAEEPVRDGITDRECQVLTLLAEGECNAAIAQRLGITEKTVKSHVSSLLDKLGMSSRVHLAVYAQNTSLLDPPITTRRDSNTH